MSGVTVAAKHLPIGLGLGLVLASLTPSAGYAMCGGNIFMTCPPSAKAAAAPDKRLSKKEARRHRGLISQGRTR